MSDKNPSTDNLQAGRELTPKRITITETYKMVGCKCMMESSLNPGIWLEVPVFIVDKAILRWEVEKLVTKREFALLQAAQEEQNLNPINKQA